MFLLEQFHNYFLLLQLWVIHKTRYHLQPHPHTEFHRLPVLLFQGQLNNHPLPPYL